MSRNRVLCASIKYLSNCPCPRCLTEKSLAGQIGTQADMSRRHKYRVDSVHRREQVEMARGWIFEKGYLVDGDPVKCALGPESLTPTRVRTLFPILYV